MSHDGAARGTHRVELAQGYPGDDQPEHRSAQLVAPAGGGDPACQHGADCRPDHGGAAEDVRAGTRTPRRAAGCRCRCRRCAADPLRATRRFPPEVRLLSEGGAAGSARAPAQAGPSRRRRAVVHRGFTQPGRRRGRRSGRSGGESRPPHARNARTAVARSADGRCLSGGPRKHSRRRRPVRARGVHARAAERGARPRPRTERLGCPARLARAADDRGTHPRPRCDRRPKAA